MSCWMLEAFSWNDSTCRNATGAVGTHPCSLQQLATSARNSGWAQSMPVRALAGRQTARGPAAAAHLQTVQEATVQPAPLSSQSP